MPDSPLPFIDYPPPPGGLHQLQQTLADKTVPEAPWGRRAAVAAVFALVAWALCLAPGWWAQQRRDQQLADALQQAPAPRRTTIEVANGAAIALPSGQSNVRLYLVQSLP